MQHNGFIRKMRNEWTSPTNPIQYYFRFKDSEFPINELIGSNLKISFTGRIQCINCSRDIKKTFAQGYCFPCFQKLPETDTCIVKPELCHHHMGTCRDNDFAEKHCFIPHVVYLANSSGAKVGITRAHQKKTRWADQGAIQALEVAIVDSRKDAGDIEVALSEHISDKTNWRRMLSSNVEEIDLTERKQQLLEFIPEEFKDNIVDGLETKLTYPIEAFPPKISSYNLDKSPDITDKLMGIKGQYLVFEKKVINIRKYQGYEITLES